MGKHRREHLAVLGGGAETCAHQRADHHRRFGFAAEHIAEFGGLIQNLVETYAHKVDKHQFGNRAHAASGGAHRRAHIGGFGKRRIEQAVAVFAIQTFGGAEHAAPGIFFAIGTEAADDVFTNHNHALITRHFQIDGLVDGLL